MKHVLTLLSLIIVAAVIGNGCGTKEKSGGKPIVVATTSMIGDIVTFIAGDSVALHTLMGPGVDPHLYKATKGDLDQFAGAGLILYNGLHLEAKLSDILKSMGESRMVVAVSEQIPRDSLRFPSQFEGNPDPHIWFDLSLWKFSVTRAEEALIALDSAHADLYRQRAAAYRDSMLALDAWVRTEISSIPESQRILVTAHDAFGYFGRAYGIEVKGLQGISTVAEAGLLDVTSMIDLLVERKIKAVFVESSVPHKTIEAVVAGCRERGHDVKVGGELYSDAMGSANTPDGTYFGMVRHNVNAIVTALR